ncbi:MAG: ABC transporter ATP-binding protein [Candidatus Tectomicrobia bacterium]|nr:ABC transporter ATP-binding protein [Candidatus Tectomicrobia bacterium]MBI2132663.1 ABC transporter ATP-binding protein [Candidatus Tectomicrobia bacterium]MBI2177660.1 ABC transporter ATP-binding protein [Candidatus Tectomicrobia bacterium]
MRGLAKSFGANRVLQGLDLKIPAGRITVIIGRSGEGKSVLLKHMIGLLRPDQGQVLVDGEDITRLRGRELNRVRAKFGMLFQGAALFDSMNVAENVAFPLREHSRLSPEEIASRVREKLRLVGLDGVEDRMPSQLSGGMRKRVGLARAIIRGPEIILYDEPTTGLDPILTDSIDRLIVRTQETLNITSVLISHDLDRALAFADFVAMLHQGRIVAQGAPEELRTMDDPLVRQFLTGSAEGPIQVL